MGNFAVYAEEQPQGIYTNLAQKDNGQDPPQSKEPKSLHFFPVIENIGIKNQ